MSRARTTFVAVLALSAVLAPLARAADLDALKTFDDANRLCAAGTTPDDFRRAASLLEALVASGYESGAVLFDLGNAWQKAGEPARALAAYRRAEPYRPRDSVLDSNTSQVLAELGKAEPARSLLDTIVFWRRWLSFPEQAALVVAFAGLAFVLGLLRVRSSVRGRSSRGVARGAAVCIVLTVVASATFALEARDVEWTEHGVVVAKQTVARKGNSDGYAPAFTEALTTGTEFTVIERAGDWAHVLLSSGLDGWVPASDVVTW